MSSVVLVATMQADTIESIAKYTGDYTHCQRFDPNIPQTTDVERLIEEIIGSPKRYFEQVADSIPPAQSSRNPGAKSTTDIEGLQKLPSRDRTASRASMIMLPATGDPVSTEPRMFPGILHEKERRRSRPISSSGGSKGASIDTTTPALAKVAVTEQEAVDQDGQSD